MTANELRKETKENLITELAATQKELVSLRLQKATGGSEASAPKQHSFKQVRRKIARIKTVLKELSQ